MKSIWLLLIYFVVVAACTVQANPTEPPVWLCHTQAYGKHMTTVLVDSACSGKFKAGDHILVEGAGERVVQGIQPFGGGDIWLDVARPTTYEKGVGVGFMPRELNPDGTPRIDPRDTQ